MLSYRNIVVNPSLQTGARVHVCAHPDHKPSSDLLSDLVPRVLYYPSGRRENLGTRLLESLNDGDDNDNDNIAKAVGLTKTLHVCSTFFDTVSLPLLRGESRGLT